MNQKLGYIVTKHGLIKIKHRAALEVLYDLRES
jgi:hypothetical protein